MFLGFKRELEENGYNGVAYTIWLEAESATRWELLDVDIHPSEECKPGATYDSIEAAKEAIYAEFYGTDVFEAFLESEPDAAYVAAIIEEDVFENGVDVADTGYEFRLELSREYGWMAG